MLEKNDIKIIKDIINNQVSLGKTALTQTIAIHLPRTGNPKFRPDYWAGYEKFLTMIEAYPDEFRIVEHSPTEKEIVIVANGDNCDNASRQSAGNLSFEGYLNEYLNDDLIADTCQRFKLTVDMQKPCIIKSYLKYRYYKAKADDKVLEHRRARMFHTGWFYNGTDPIFCIWGDGTHQTHAFNFVRQSGNDGRELRKLFNNRVPEQLIFPIIKFQHEWDIEPEFGHIFGDRIYRIPNEVKRMIAAARGTSSDYVQSADSEILYEHHNYLRRLLMGCLYDTRDRIRNSTDEAVLFWNKRTNSMSWLFPLRMGVSEEVNLVAILEPTTLNGKDIYRAHTILGLKEAFNNARLLGPVRAEWLKDAWRQ